MNDRYPLYQEWVDLSQRSNNGLLAIAVIAAIAVLWLIYARAWWPAWLPRIRAALLIVFYTSWVLVFVIGLASR